jgi:Putative glycosyl/glycerophosphate transferases involved in teichoic acid biosynthesis TagF/TagB/EpsJ/RodC
MQKAIKVSTFKPLKKFNLRDLIYQLCWKFLHKPEVVFYAGSPIEYVMFKEIFKFLPEVKIITKNTKKNERVREYLNSIQVPCHSGWVFPQIMITAHFPKAPYQMPEIKKIAIFHGMAKVNMFDVRHGQVDLSLIMGDYTAEKFDELGRRYEIVGYPKIDGLFNGSIDVNHYRHKLGIDNHKKTILYAPSWNKGGSIEHLWNHLPEIAQEYNFLVKLHDKSVAQWRPKISKYTNIILIDDPDVVPYYLLADVMISDYSSVIFEYAVLDKPIVLFNSNVKINPNGICYKWRDIGMNVENVTELQEAIKLSLMNPKEFSDKRLFYAKQIFKYRDGLSAKRAAEKIVEFCEENGVKLELLDNKL